MGGGLALDWAMAEQLVESETYRAPWPPGYDRDDIRQESRIAAWKAMKRADAGRYPRAYVRQAIRWTLRNLLARETAQRRAPHDAWGRPTDLVPLFERAVISDSDEVHEDACCRRRVEKLSKLLDPRDWYELTGVFVDAAEHARATGAAPPEARGDAESIFRRLWYRVEREDDRMSVAEQQVYDEPIPECHADGTEPQGYDPEEEECRMCPDKHTCLPRSIMRRLTPHSVEVDREVEAVQLGLLTRDGLIQRLRERRDLRRAKEPIPDHLRHDFAGLVTVEPATKTRPTVQQQEAPEEPEEAPEERDTKPDVRTPPVEPEEPEEAAEDPEEGPVAFEEEPEQASAPVKRKRTRKAPSKQPEVRARRNGEVYIGDVKVGRVATEEGWWGWYSADGKSESPEWYETKADVLESLAKAKPTAQLLKKAAKPAPKAKAKRTAKRAVKPDPKPKRKSSKKETRGRRAMPDHWPVLSTGKAFPRPRKLTREQMDDRLEQAQAKLGCNVELDYGMQIVRRKRTEDCVVTITPEGFEMQIDPDVQQQAGLKSAVQTFASLSSAAQWFERRSVTGNDFFNIAKHKCTEIRDKKGRVIDRQGGI